MLRTGLRRFLLLRARGGCGRRAFWKQRSTTRARSGPSSAFLTSLRKANQSRPWATGEGLGWGCLLTAVPCHAGWCASSIWAMSLKALRHSCSLTFPPRQLFCPGPPSSWTVQAAGTTQCSRSGWVLSGALGQEGSRAWGQAEGTGLSSSPNVTLLIFWVLVPAAGLGHHPKPTSVSTAEVGIKRGRVLVVSLPPCITKAGPSRANKSLLKDIHQS